MAKKIDFNLDDFDFDSEFDKMDFNFEAKEVKDDRNPSTKVMSGVAKGVKSTLASEPFIVNTIKNLLPKGYGSTVDVVTGGRDSIKDLYNSSAEEIRPVINELKKTVGKAIPTTGRYLPGDMAKRLERWAETGEEDFGSYSYTDNNEDEISRNLAEIFSIQSKNQDAKDQEQDYKDQLTESLSFTKHKESVGQLNQMRLSLSQLVSYQDKITANYQRKSLELQYRQFFIAKESLTENKRVNAEFKEYLESINKNTALPDYVKLKQSERLGEALRNRFIDEGIQGFLGSGGGYVKRVGERFRNRALGNLRELTSGMRFGLSAANDLMDTQAQMKEMGMVDDPYETAGRFAGSAAPSFITGSRVGNRLRDKLSKNETIAKYGNKLQYEVQNLPGRANEFARSSKGSFGAFSFLVDPLKQALLEGSENYHVDIDNIKNLQAPSVFTRQSNKSITEIIPGLLSRIHNELQIMRTGDDTIEPINYDYTKNKFNSASIVNKNILKSVINPVNKETVTNEIERLLDQVDPKGTLSPEARKALGTQLLADNMEGRLGTPERLGKESIYRDDAQQYASQYTSLFNDHFANDEDYSKRVKFSEGFTNLGRFIDIDRSNMQHIVNMGLHGALVDADLLSMGGADARDPAGYINKDNYFNYYYGKDIKANTPTGGGTGPHFSSNPFNKVDDSHRGSDPYSDEPLFGNNASDLLNAIKEISPINLLTITNQSLESIDSKLSSGITSFNLGDMSPEALKAFMESQGKPNEGNKSSGPTGFIRDTYDLVKRFGKGVFNTVREGSWFTNNLSKGASNLFKNVSSMLGTATDTIIGRGKELTDVFIGNDVKPRLEAWKLKAGLYRDEVTGKIITNFKDIKGSVIDENGDVILKQEDIKYAYTRTKVGIRRLTTLGSGMTGGFFSNLTKRIRSMDILKTGLLPKNKNINLSKAKEIYDVYIPGKLTPILQNWKLNASMYIDSATGKAIKSFNDIKGDVLDEEGNLVIGFEDLKHAYTRTTEGIKPLNIIKRGFDTIRDIASSFFNKSKTLGNRAGRTLGKGKDWLFNKPGEQGVESGSDESTPGTGPNDNKSPFEKGVGGIFNLGKKGIDLAKNAGSLLTTGTANGLQNLTNFFVGGLGTVFRGRKIENQLIRIYKLLDERLAGKKIRKGSYEDQMKEQEEEDKEKSINDHMSSIAGSSWNNSIYGMGAAGISKLMNRNKDRKGEDEEGGGLGDSAAAGVAGAAGASLLGKLKGAAKWGLKKVPVVAGLGSAALSAYNMSKEGFNLFDASVMAGGLTLAAPKMMLGGAALLGKGALAAGGLLMSAVSAPVLLGAAAVGGVGYLGYKLFTRKKPQPLSTIRYAQYGFLVGDIDRFRTILQFEDMLLSMVKVSDTQAQIDVQKFQKKVNDIAKLFNVNQEDEFQMANWSNWYVNRFRPIFLQHVGMLHKLDSKVKLVDVDDDLNEELKTKYIHDTTVSNSLMSSSTSPFPNDGPLEATSGHVDELIKDTLAELSTEKKSSWSGLELVKGKIKGAVNRLIPDPPSFSIMGMSIKDMLSGDLKSNALKVVDHFNPFSSLLSAVPSIKALGGKISNLFNPKIGDITKLRMLQYGFSISDDEVAKKLIALDKLVYPFIKNIETNPKLEITDKKTLNEIYKLMGVNTKDDNALHAFTDWLNNRYAPVLVEHVKAFKAIGKPIDFVNVDNNLSVNEKVAYVKVAAPDTLDYRETYSPFSINERFENNKNSVSAFKSRFIETAKSSGGVEETLLEDEGKTGFFSKAKSFFGGLKDKLFGKSKDKEEIPITPSTGQGLGSSMGAAAAAAVSQGSSSPVLTTPNLTVDGGSVGTSITSGTGGGSLSSTTGKGQKLSEAQIAKIAMEEGITDKTELAMFMAQLHHESGGFKRIEENLNYKAATLRRVFPKYFKSEEEARQVASQGPAAIANRVYGGRMGNNQPGDGYKYRGRGYIQLTGKNNYKAYSKHMGVDLVNNPDIISNDPVMGVKASIAYWKHRGGIPEAARSGNLERVTKIINGGSNGLADRRNQFAKYMNMDLGSMASGADPISQGGGVEGPSGSPMANNPSLTSGGTNAQPSAIAGSIMSGLSSSPSETIASSGTMPLLSSLGKGVYGGSVVDDGSNGAASINAANNAAGGNSSVAGTVNPLLSSSPVSSTLSPTVELGGSGGYGSSVNPSTNVTTSPNVTPVSTSPDIAFNGFNPAATMSTRDLALQQKQNAVDNTASFAPLHDSMKESVSVSKEHLDVSRKSLQVLVTLAEIVSKGFNNKDNTTDPIEKDSYKDRASSEARLFTSTTNAPISLAKKFA